MWHLGTGDSGGLGSTGLPKSLMRNQGLPCWKFRLLIQYIKRGEERKSTRFHWCTSLGCSSLAKNDTTLSNSFQLLQEANEQTRASFNPGPLWELDLWAHRVCVRFLEGVKTIKQRSIILGGKQKFQKGESVFQEHRNCSVNLILTKQGRNDERKSSCKHPNHVEHLQWELKTLQTHKPSVPLAENQAVRFGTEASSRAPWTFAGKGTWWSLGWKDILTPNARQWIKEQHRRCWSKNTIPGWFRIGIQGKSCCLCSCW